MPNIGRILFDEAHNAAWTIRPEAAVAMNPHNPADAGYVRAAAVATNAGFVFTAHPEGLLTDKALEGADVVVLPHGSDPEWEATTKTGATKLSEAELEALEKFVRNGGGLIIFGETEQPKYSNSHAELARRFGIEIHNATVQDPTHCHKDVATWVIGEPQISSTVDVLAGSTNACFYRAGTLSAIAGTKDVTDVLFQSSAVATPASAPLVMTSKAGAGRVVVLADSDLFGDDSIADLDHETLWVNLLTWAATRSDEGIHSKPQHEIVQTAAWISLVDAVETLRTMQSKDGSIDLNVHSSEVATKAALQMKQAITDLLPFFAHQHDHLVATNVDIQRWIDGGFTVPDFYDSLQLFRPDLDRVDGVKNLVVFPMYTQNGNPNRNFEAVITNTFWPDWLAEQEATTYKNPAFVPIEFVGFTKGYDTHSAVLFPETVATRETAQFYWGGIFCDREAARFRKISKESVGILKLALPADAEMLLSDQKLAQETFVLWDLIHDRAHSHGDLPFDPFMIKQRMPFWMYALEELRCDLNTFRETIRLETEGIYFSRFIRYAILFDRLFRFPTTGDRVRNYDGLGGQIIFAWLHRHDVLRWTNNTLTIDWNKVNDSIVELCDAVEELYRDGIDRSRLAHWLAAYEFVSTWVEPHPASTWAKGVDALPVEGELKHLVDAVMPDEFPLNVFYEALRTKLSPTIAAVAGITG